MAHRRHLPVVTLHQPDADWWDELVRRAPGGTLFQTTHWADYVADYLGWEPTYLLAQDSGGQPAGMLLMFRKSLAHSLVFETPVYSAARPFLRFVRPVYSWLYGPLNVGMLRPEMVTQSILEEVAAIARGSRAVGLVDVRLPIHGIAPAEPLTPEVGSPLRVRRQATLLLDLQAPEETLWRRLKPAARKNVRRVQEQGVEVRRLADESELAEYHELFTRCRRALKLHANEFAFWEKLWKHLRPAGCLEIFTARHEGRLVAGLGIWAFNGVIYEFAAIQTPEAHEARTYANDLLKWEVIRWGHASGQRIYDLVGVAREPSTPSEAGIRQFKEKWGGELVEFDEFDHFCR